MLLNPTQQSKVILLCGGRIALPTMRDLIFTQQLAVVTIPAHCDEFIEQATLLLTPLNIPIILIKKQTCTTQLLTAIKQYYVTIGLIATFSFKITDIVYQTTPKGFYNVHPGLLPNYRGSDPIFQQIKNKEKYAAITLHKVDEEFDSGEIVLTEKIILLPTDTYGMLTTKLAELSSKLVTQLLKIISYNVAIPGLQQNQSLAKYYKKQTATDVTINWQTMDAPTIVALINACNPWNKGAITKLNNHILRLVQATAEATTLAQAVGTICSIDERSITVVTINQLLCVTIVYTDEGFFTANKLESLGVVVGNCFQNV